MRLNAAKANVSSVSEMKNGPPPLTKSVSRPPPGSLFSQPVSHVAPAPKESASEAAESIVSVVAPTRKKSTRKSR